MKLKNAHTFCNIKNTQANRQITHKKSNANDDIVKKANALSANDEQNEVYIIKRITNWSNILKCVAYFCTKSPNKGLATIPTTMGNKI